MESETIETFLRSLGLDNLITPFKENDIDVDLLMDVSDEELKGLMDEIKVSTGNRFRITKGIQKLKAGRMYITYLCKRHFFDAHKTLESSFNKNIPLDKLLDKCV